jgi:hypothetical protein
MFWYVWVTFVSSKFPPTEREREREETGGLRVVVGQY